MDEVKKFLSIVRKYLSALVVVPIVTIIIAFFLVRNAPDSFMSQAQIATGIVDETRQYQQQSLTNLGVLPNDQVNQEFSNLITMMKMKKMLDQVSYKLIIHDLTAEKPFRKPSQEIRYLNKSARAHALSVYRSKYAKKEALNLWDRDQNGIHNVLTSMGYDSESLSKNLNIYRAGSSDFINIEYESEDPVLSALVVNTLSAEFISYYSTIVRTNKVKAATFLNALLKEKSDTLSKRMAVLRDYKIKNRVLNLDEQSSQLYTSIVEYDTKKQEAIQNTSSYAGALNEIDRKFSPGERKYLEATLSKVNQDIVITKEELSRLYDLYYKSDFDETYKNSIDSLQAKLTSEINRSSDQYITNPLTAKETLVQQKLDLEVKLDVSRYSINALESELSRLNAQFDALVPKEAEVQSYEMGIEMATKEYLDILNRYNQSSLESEVPIKLNIVQPGMPGLPQPSKKMLLIILSGIISLVFVMVVLFIFFLLDNRIISAEGLANKTQLPVIGDITVPDIPSLNINDIWKDDAQSPQITELKSDLRSIRHEIETSFKGKVLAVTSLNAEDGKAFLATGLAFAWVMTNRRVLIIDGNFSSPTISGQTSSKLYVEDFLKAESPLVTAANSSSLTVIKNRGGDVSLMEITTSEMIAQKLGIAKEMFDLIIIETGDLKSNHSREWISFADGIIAIFNNGQNIGKQAKINVSYLKESGLFQGWILNNSNSAR